MSRPRIATHLSLAAKLALAVAVLYWLTDSGRLDWHVYGRILNGPNGGLLLLMLAIHFAAFSTFIVRWRPLVIVQGVLISWRAVLTTGYRGLFTQLFVPGGLGSDGLRVHYLSARVANGLSVGISSVLVDRIIGLTSLVVVGLLSGGMLTISGRNDVLLPILGAAALLLVGVVALLILISAAAVVPGWVPSRAVDQVKAVVSSVRVYGGHGGILLKSVVVSAFGQVLTAVGAYLGLLTLGVEPASFTVVLAITCVLNLVRMLPITPLGLGVTDAASEGLFDLVGISMGAELQMLLRLVSVLIFTLCGLAFFYRDSHEDDRPRRAA